MVQRFITPNAPHSLLLFETLRHRMNLSSVEQQRYDRLYKGFIGELKLGSYFSDVNLEKVLPLFGLLVESGETEFQVDCLILTSDTVYLLEVKNYAGDYYIDNDKIYSVRTRNEIFNPFIQLERSTFLLKQLLKQLKINIDVRAYIVFVSKQFTLYKAPLHLPIILPGQIKRFLRQTSANASQLTSRSETIAKLLTSRHKETSAYERLPSYEIDDVARGVFCVKCGNQLQRKNKSSFACQHCQINFLIDNIILQTIVQYHLLFPNNKITTQHIVDWSGNAFSKNAVRKVLSTNLKTIAKGKHTHYLFHDSNKHLKLLAQLYYE